MILISQGMKFGEELQLPVSQLWKNLKWHNIVAVHYKTCISLYGIAV